MRSEYVQPGLDSFFSWLYILHSDIYEGQPIRRKIAQGSMEEN